MDDRQRAEYMHNYYLANKGKWGTGEKNPCACGCGEITQRKFVRGHNKRGMEPLEKYRRAALRRIRNFCLRPEGRAYGTPCTLRELPPIPGNCPACGKKWSLNGTNGHSEDVPSVDRIISSLGYVAGNVVWICKECNRRLSDSTPEQLRRLADFREKCLTNNRSRAIRLQKLNYAPR